MRCLRHPLPDLPEPPAAPQVPPHPGPRPPMPVWPASRHVRSVLLAVVEPAGRTAGRAARRGPPGARPRCTPAQGGPDHRRPAGTLVRRPGPPGLASAATALRLPPITLRHVSITERRRTHACRMDVSAQRNLGGLQPGRGASCATRGREPARLRRCQGQRPLPAGGRYSALVPVTRWPGFRIPDQPPPQPSATTAITSSRSGPARSCSATRATCPPARTSYTGCPGSGRYGGGTSR
jgi:hypothetical protein